MKQKRTQHIPNTNIVKSLLGCMKDGSEYASIADKLVQSDFNLIEEVKLSIKEIEEISGRPCLLYVGNISDKGGPESGIISGDDLPFKELVNSVYKRHKSVDILLATNGGSGEQVCRFVTYLRERFSDINFLLPSFCMSAGTLFALSGDKIFMSKHSFLGPIDPQVPSSDGRYVPAQALLLLVEKLKEDGEKALREGKNIPWTAVRIIDGIDKKQLGAAVTASDWAKKIAKEYLLAYKFKNWDVRDGSSEPVTDEYKGSRAEEIADALSSHERWKNHGHSISREVLWSELKLKIDYPNEALERAIVRMWALLTWIFDKTNTQKLFVGESYSLVRATINNLPEVKK